jgi:hypothetical protein
MLFRPHPIVERRADIANMECASGRGSETGGYGHDADL